MERCGCVCMRTDILPAEEEKIDDLVLIFTFEMREVCGKLIQALICSSVNPVQTKVKQTEKKQEASCFPRIPYHHLLLSLFLLLMSSVSPLSVRATPITREKKKVPAPSSCECMQLFTTLSEPGTLASPSDRHALVPQSRGRQTD